jgi:hypothetical protein
MHDALARDVAPSSWADGLSPKTLSRVSFTGRLSLAELVVLLKACPEMIEHLKLNSSMRIIIKFQEDDGETYSYRRLIEFLGGWFFSAIGSDSMAAREY